MDKTIKCLRVIYLRKWPSDFAVFRQMEQYSFGVTRVSKVGSAEVKKGLSSLVLSPFF